MKALNLLACAVVVVGLSGPARAQDASAAVTATAAGPGQAQKPPAQKPPAPQPAKPKPQPVKPAPLTPAQLARRAPGRPGSFEVAAGGAWLGSASLGTSTANMTANGSSTPYRYFDATGNMGSTPGLDARLTYNLSRRLAVEGGVSYSAPTVTATIGNDAEGATAVAAPNEKMTQYFVDADVLFFLPGLSFRKGRGRVFVEGGGGYLRQLHEGGYNVETGTVYNAGGGIRYYFKPRPRGLVKGFGLRLDARAYYKSGGASFDGAATLSPALGAAAIVAF